MEVFITLCQNCMMMMVSAMYWYQTIKLICFTICCSLLSLQPSTSSTLVSLQVIIYVAVPWDIVTYLCTGTQISCCRLSHLLLYLGCTYALVLWSTVDGYHMLLYLGAYLCICSGTLVSHCCTQGHTYSGQLLQITSCIGAYLCTSTLFSCRSFFQLVNDGTN